MHEPIWNEETLFLTGDSFFQQLSITLSGAKKTIDLETYIFDEDELGNQILSQLSDAVKRGVRVRILLDGVGSSNWNHEEAEIYRKKGIEIRFFHPLPWQKAHFKFWNYLTLKKITLGLFKLNHRNHRKTCLIDEEIAYLGSMNVSKRHLVSHSGTEAWRDTAIRVKGPGIAQLTSVFNTAWKYSENYFSLQRMKEKISFKFQSVRLNHNELQGELYRKKMIQALSRAQKRIWITNPYFVPDRNLFRTLIRAASSGIDVRLLFPHKTDFVPGQFASRSFYGRLLKRGAKIYEYLPSMLHAKVMIIDDQATIGSSNLNHRSFFRDLEADILLSNSENVSKLCDQFELDLKQSRMINEQKWNQRSIFHRLAEKLFLLFRGIL